MPEWVAAKFTSACWALHVFAALLTSALAAVAFFATHLPKAFAPYVWLKSFAPMAVWVALQSELAVAAAVGAPLANAATGATRAAVSARSINIFMGTYLLSRLRKMKLTPILSSEIRGRPVRRKGDVRGRVAAERAVESAAEARRDRR